MKFNKMLAKTFIFATAISFAPSLGTTAKAAPPSSITFSAANQEVTVPENTYWGTVKVLKKDKGSNLTEGKNYYKVENVDKVVGTKLNLSNMKFSKDTLIAFGSSSIVSTENWVVKTFPAEEKTLKVYYGNSKDFGKFTGTTHTHGDKEVGFIGASIGKKDPKEVDTANLEVHNGNGTWQAYTTFFGGSDDAKVIAKLKGLVQTGATLYFRQKGTDAKFTVNSKEAKIKIPAQAAAPKLTIKDGKTGLKKGLEYIAKLDTEADMGNVWITVDETNLENAKFTDKIFTDKSKGYNFYIRNAAKGKKGASKFRKLSVTHAPVPEIAEVSGKNKANIIEATGAENLIKDTQNVAFKVGLKTKLKYDITKGVELTNSSDKNYEVFLSFTDAAPASNAKWITLKAAKDPLKPTKISFKHSDTDKPNTFATGKTSKLYVRRPAEKQVGNKVVLASDALDFTFGVENVVQTAEFEAEQDAPVAVDNSKKYKATLHSVAPAELKVYTFKIAATKLVKTGAKPKVKIDKMDGVKVTIGAFGEDMKAEIKVELSNKAFPTASDITEDKVLNIIMNYEGIKDKAFEIHFSKDAKS